MIIKIGDLFESKAKTIVNTINCVGVMGKGIALEFKKRYPEMYNEYIALCKAQRIKPGVPYYYTDFTGASILNFPTKDHWRSPSKLSYIINGLNWFKQNYQQCGITSIAFPPLGCGNGGLTWEVVGPIMYDALKDLPIDVEIYAPYGTSSELLSLEYLENRRIESSKDILGAKSLPFNKYWLLILYVIQLLNHDRYSLSVGRTILQKICYLLARVGLPMGFTFVKGVYGPYAKEVKSAITVLSNANYMTERQLGQMVETVVAPSFSLPKENYTSEEIESSNKVFDLLSRVKSTDQAEVLATILFSFDKLSEKEQPTEQQIFDYVLQWKPRWKNQKESDLIATIGDLASLGWMKPRTDCGMLNNDIY